MDSFAKDGVLFENFYSSGVCTGTAFSSIHTGLYPIHHGIYNVTPPTHILDEIPTLAAVLRASGYTTAAFDNLAYNREWCQDTMHYYRGFETYVTDVSDPKDWNELGERVRADWYNQRLIPWIDTHSDEEFFAFVHYWDVHQPYTQPKPFRELYHHNPGDLSDLEVRDAPAGYRYVPGWGKIGELFEGYGVVPEQRSPGTVPSREASIDLYDGSITYLDQCIAEVVEKLDQNGILDDTLIVVTSDHGELLGQHGIYTHVNMYEANIHIPLILRCPSLLQKGKRINGFASQVDILPTILDLTGISEIPQTDGVSLKPSIDGTPLHNEMFSEDGGGIRTVRKDEWKLIHYYHNDDVELYNVANDPMEVLDLAISRSDVVTELRARLNQWVESNLQPGTEDPLEYVKRNYDFPGNYQGMFMERYRNKGFVPYAQ